MSKYKFPTIKHKCYACGGTGKENIPYHRNPTYADCHHCKGKKNVLIEREMDTEEKLEHLLKLICELKSSIRTYI